MNHISLIHGIRTGLTDPNWTQHCQNFLELHMPQVAIATETYAAGPLPWWNVWVTNPRYARAYAGRIAAFRAEHQLRRAEAELLGLHMAPLRVRAPESEESEATGAIRATFKRTGPEPVTTNHEKTSRKTTYVHRVRSLALFSVGVDDSETVRSGLVLVGPSRAESDSVLQLRRKPADC